MEPFLLKACDLDPSDTGSFEWNATHNSDVLNFSQEGRTIEWDASMSRYTGKYPPVWVAASTRAGLHSADYQWDFVVAEMGEAQIGVGFMLLWNIGPDWGFYGYLGASNSAWAYDPSTGDVVRDTRSIEGGLPRFSDGQRGVVTVRLSLPRETTGSGQFVVGAVQSQPIALPEGSVILPAACLLRPAQKVTLANFQRTSH
ncbi:MAG: hypothetical protein HY319_04415 [Armatimonadetes bacterium]|nr:hypothetical protein [Armatimonadota bacterium]